MWIVGKAELGLSGINLVFLYKIIEFQMSLKAMLMYSRLILILFMRTKGNAIPELS